MNNIKEIHIDVLNISLHVHGYKGIKYIQLKYTNIYRI